ncbi:guanitoxin biosynthesis heme-dependent pre-guanitoxin N-hydroxylase GntA [Roseibium sp.]|uniref:guanitoxin biosynthesis heme-dependent pre-guanitoxin N-hydroxylase GntA n=1 Tax=Roseibium sp. TaxID=1936156 RepID=UPI003A9779C2
MNDQDLKQAFEDFISSNRFPCVGAKSALVRDNIVMTVAEDIDRPTSDLEIHEAIRAFHEELDLESPVVQSLAILFKGPRELGENDFENALWDRLQCLHNLDVATGEIWNPDVANDPNDAHFSMSLCGEPFFVVGLHPNASRPARRFDYPVLVFNSHRQFEKLRADGRFEKMKQVIRERDRELAGSINPMLDDFGGSSEARQYSGRTVDNDWKCPFSYKEGAA